MEWANSGGGNNGAPGVEGAKVVVASRLGVIWFQRARSMRNPTGELDVGSGMLGLSRLPADMAAKIQNGDASASLQMKLTSIPWRRVGTSSRPPAMISSGGFPSSVRSTKFSIPRHSSPS